ncbi:MULTISPECIES: glycerate kinase [Actinomycetes]|uniref:Glycerate kinase n=2 Tax=Actinomycetes TaxID=1760 RepID=A0ABP6LT04_9MICC
MASTAAGPRTSTVVIAPDTFKGSLGAGEVAQALASGIRRTAPGTRVVEVPMADGGEGTLDAAAAGWEIEAHWVTGPDGRPTRAQLGLRTDDGGTTAAVVELAEASGLHDMGPGADPMRATSRGTGELLRAALDRGADEVVLALGGSACTDGGAGMLSALGVRLLDRAGRRIPEGAAGLSGLDSADLRELDPRIAQTRIVIAADVDSPLTGPQGAAEVFGPQKGLDEQQVRWASLALQRAVPVLAEAAYRSSGPTWSDHVVRAADQPGAGAAGGVGFAALALLGAERRPGVEVVMELVDLEARMAGADLVITGEGSLDTQSLAGKVPVGVARVSARHGIPVVAVCGRSLLDRDQWAAAGIDHVWALRDLAGSDQESIRRAPALLQEVGGRIGQELAARSRQRQLMAGPAGPGEE